MLSFCSFAIQLDRVCSALSRRREPWLSSLLETKARAILFLLSCVMFSYFEEGHGKFLFYTKPLFRTFGSFGLLMLWCLLFQGNRLCMPKWRRYFFFHFTVCTLFSHPFPFNCMLSKYKNERCGWQNPDIFCYRCVQNRSEQKGASLLFLPYIVG
jgi:hypothetical protein